MSFEKPLGFGTLAQPRLPLVLTGEMAVRATQLPAMRHAKGPGSGTKAHPALLLRH